MIPDGLDATLVLLRHGESTFIAEGRFQGQAEVPLSAIGRRQAQLAAQRLARPHDSPALPVPLTRPLEIVHSPLRRTAETAASVASAMGDAAPPVRPEPGILEIAQGAWEGRLHTEIEARWGDVLAAWRRRPVEAWAPGGESLPEVQARVRPAIGALLERLADGRPPGSLDRPQVLGYRDPVAEQPWSILVGHDGVFKVILLTLFGIPLEHFWTFSFALCGITVVELRGGRASLRAHNLVEHLAPILDERALALTEARQRTGAL